MSNDEASDRTKFDLEKRTANFGEDVVRFLRTVKLTAMTDHLINQLIRAGTSIGAHYAEADDAGSKREFRYRISLAVRESRESKHWCHMIATALPERRLEIRTLYKEADELNRIFKSIHRNSGPSR